MMVFSWNFQFIFYSALGLSILLLLLSCKIYPNISQFWYFLGIFNLYSTQLWDYLYYYYYYLVKYTQTFPNDGIFLELSIYILLSFGIVKYFQTFPNFGIFLEFSIVIRLNFGITCKIFPNIPQFWYFLGIFNCYSTQLWDYRVI